MIVKPEDLERLTDYEREVLEKWQNEGNKPPLSPVTSARFFGLYFNGVDCREICRLNDYLYPLGLILEARIRDGWDRRRDEQIEALYSGIADRAKQAQLQSVSFVSDMLAATAKLHGDKVKRFLQSGDENEIKDVPVGSLDSYKKLVELLLKLTGQDKAGSGGGSTKVNVMTTGSTAVKVDGAGSSGGGMDSDTAEKILALLEGENGK